MSNFYQGVAEQELERDIERSFVLLIRGAKDMVREFLEMELDFTTQFSYLLLQVTVETRLFMNNFFICFGEQNIKIIFLSLLIMFLMLGKLKRAQ